MDYDCFNHMKMSNDIMILMRLWILDRCLMDFDYVFEHIFFLMLFLVYHISIKHCYICEETQLHFASWEFDPACAESCPSKSL